MSDINTSETQTVVFRAVDRVNELLAETQQLQKARGALLLETGTVLDSMAVINLLVFIEDEIKTAFGRDVVLAGENGSGPIREESLKTLGTLIDSIHTILVEPQ